MRVDIIELLRCPAAHEPTPLVTVAVRRDGDRLIDATLGCPVCGAEYALRDGEAFLVGEGQERAPTASDAPSDSAADPMRIAALLGLSEPGVRVALCGAMGAAASVIEDATGARCVVVNAPRDTAGGDRLDRLVIGEGRTIPLASASLSGLAVDAAHWGLLADAARAVRVGGRVVAPARVPVPDGCRELARDASQWVATVEAAVTAPVGLRKASVTS